MTIEPIGSNMLQAGARADPHEKGPTSAGPVLGRKLPKKSPRGRPGGSGRGMLPMNPGTECEAVHTAGSPIESNACVTHA
jgi:hypothetical protein